PPGDRGADRHPVLHREAPRSRQAGGAPGARRQRAHRAEPAESRGGAMKPEMDAGLRRYPLRSPARYGIAAAIGGLGLVLGVVLPIHGAYKLLFFTSYMVLILVSAALGGFGPGLVCTLLCAGGVAWWLEPQGSFAIGA